MHPPLLVHCLSRDSKFKEVWTISRQGDTWQVRGSYTKGDAKAGGFRGQKVRYARGRLSFQQVFYQLPDPTWAKVNNIVAWAKGDALTFDWNRGRAKWRV